MRDSAAVGRVSKCKHITAIANRKKKEDARSENDSIRVEEFVRGQIPLLLRSTGAGERGKRVSRLGGVWSGKATQSRCFIHSNSAPLPFRERLSRAIPGASLPPGRPRSFSSSALPSISPLHELARSSSSSPPSLWRSYFANCPEILNATTGESKKSLSLASTHARTGCLVVYVQHALDRCRCYSCT